MKTARIHIDGRPVPAKAERAETLPQRLRGLLGREGLASDRAMLLYRCNSIHTLFMRFAIDVAFLDRDGVVVRVFRGIRPWRVILPVPRATDALETAAGTLERLGVVPGVRLTFPDTRDYSP